VARGRAYNKKRATRPVMERSKGHDGIMTAPVIRICTVVSVSMFWV